MFQLAPALALFLLGYVLSARTWRLLTGCCAPGARARCGSGLRAAAALAPLTWVAVALLGGSFCECAASGSALLARRACAGRDPGCTELPRVPCGQAPAWGPDVCQELRAQSQVGPASPRLRSSCCKEPPANI